MKDKVLPNINVAWQHNETYSILRKVETLNPQVYDFVLTPPLIVKNCLPCALKIELTDSTGSESQY